MCCFGSKMTLFPLVHGRQGLNKRVEKGMLSIIIREVQDALRA